VTTLVLNRSPNSGTESGKEFPYRWIDEQPALNSTPGANSRFWYFVPFGQPAGLHADPHRGQSAMSSLPGKSPQRTMHMHVQAFLQTSAFIVPCRSVT
jgi:hypothetical protein